MVKKRWMPITVLLFGFLLRVFHLGGQSIWYDEGVSLYLAQQTPREIVHHTAGDIHPPLYYLVLHFWTSVVGDSEFAAAFLSVIFGLLIIITAYKLTTFLFDETTGLVAGSIIALSTYNIWYSQEIRMYTLGAFLGLLSFWGAWQFREKGATGTGQALRYGALYVVSAVLGLYTLYYFSFLLIAINLWILSSLLGRWHSEPEARTTTRRWVAAQLAVIALYTPWLGTAVHQALDPPVPPWRSGVSLWTIAVESWSALSFGHSMVNGPFTCALILLGVIYLVGTVITCKRNMGQGLGLLMYTFCPIGIIAVASLWRPLFHARYVFTYSPMFYVVLAVGLIWIYRRQALVGAVVAAIYLAGSGYSFYEAHYNPLHRSDDFRGASRSIAERIRPDDVILINAGYAYPPFLYYYPDKIAWRGRLVDYVPETNHPEGDRGSDDEPTSDETIVLQTGSIDGSPNLGWGDPDSDFYATTEDETAKALERVFKTHPRVWVLRVYDTVVDAKGFVRSWLGENGFLFEDQLFAGESYIRVQGYLTQTQPQLIAPPQLRVSGAVFGESLKLVGCITGSDCIRSREGHLWDIDLYWESLRALPTDYRVLVELVDSRGQPWARSDEMPLGTAYPTSHWQAHQVLRQPVRLSLPELMPTDDYELQIMVYDPKQQLSLGVTASRERVEQERLVIVEIPYHD